MPKLEDFSGEVLETLQERGLTDNALADMTVMDVVREYLEWHGIIGYTGQILRAVEQARIAVLADEASKTPVWKCDPFTEEERKSMINMMEEEIRGSTFQIAEETLDSLSDDNDDLVELISYADDDPSTTAELIQAIEEENAGMDDYESGEFEDHVKRAEFMRRHQLVVGDMVTSLGRLYRERNG